MEYFTPGLSGLNVHRTELEQPLCAGCWDSSEVWPQEAPPALLPGAISLISEGLGTRGAAGDQLVPSPLSLTLLAFWSHWSSVRLRCCLGRAASVLRDQSWLSPSLRGWIWCQGQGKAAAAAPEHHPRTCLLVKVLLAPGEAPAFHSKSLQSTET